MTNNTYIDKMECTPFSRQIDSVISLTFDGEYACKPHIFTCYNNEVSSSLYLHNKLILLESSQNYTRGSSDKNIELIISQLINDLNNKLAQFINKDIFYEYINNIPNPFSYIKYIKSSDILYTEKTFATSKGFIMYSTGDGGTESGGDSGTLNHDLLFNRDLVNQHPISSITGLTEALNGKALSGHYHDNYLSDINKMMVESVLTGDISTHSHSIYALLNGSPSEDFAVKDLRAKGIGYFENGVVMFGTEGGMGGGIGGTFYHDLLENRNIANQHTIEAITNLQTTLDSKISSSDYRLTNARSSSDVYQWAKATTKPIYTADEIGALKVVRSNLVNGDNIDWNSIDFDTYALTISQIALPNYTGQTNYPFNNYGQLLTYGAYGSGFSSQLAISDSGKFSFRNQYNSNIHSGRWNTVWHNNNFDPNATTRATNQLEAFASDNFTSGEHYVKAIRENSWKIRLWGCYNMGYGLADEVCVGYANNAIRSNGADALWAIEPEYKNMYKLYLSYNNINRWILRVTPESPPHVQVDYALSADFLQTPDYGIGSILIGTNVGLLPGYPDRNYPTIKSTYSYLYFAASNTYVLAVGREGNSTAFSTGDLVDFKFNGSIKTIGTVVMFSTT